MEAHRRLFLWSSFVCYAAGLHPQHCPVLLLSLASDTDNIGRQLEEGRGLWSERS